MTGVGFPIRKCWKHIPVRILGVVTCARCYRTLTGGPR